MIRVFQHTNLGVTKQENKVKTNLMANNMGKERTWEIKFWNHIDISFLNKLLIQKENIHFCKSKVNKQMRMFTVALFIFLGRRIVILFFYFNFYFVLGYSQLKCHDNFRWTVKGFNHTCTCIHSTPPKLTFHPDCHITLSSFFCYTVGPCWLRNIAFWWYNPSKLHSKDKMNHKEILNYTQWSFCWQ